MKKILCALISIFIALSVGVYNQGFNFSKPSKASAENSSIPHVPVPGAPSEDFEKVVAPSAPSELTVNVNGDIFNFSTNAQDFSQDFNVLSKGLEVDNTSNIEKITIQGASNTAFQIKIKDLSSMNVESDSPVKLLNNANVVLRIEGVCEFLSQQNFSNINVSSGNSIIITSENSGELKVNSGMFSSQIGSNKNQNAGNITIAGNVKIQSVLVAANGTIGSGENGEIENINIQDSANVIAKGSNGNASIGTGTSSTATCKGTINISGDSNVQVLQYLDGAGIGSGKNTKVKSINIGGNAKVYVTLKGTSGCGVGFGAVSGVAPKQESGAINITESATVMATSNTNGAAIGTGNWDGSYKETFLDINISGKAKVSGTYTEENNGSVVQISGSNGAGIGGGNFATVNSINIKDSPMVVGIGSIQGAGIGSGYNNTCNEINIQGGFILCEVNESGPPLSYKYDIGSGAFYSGSSHASLKITGGSLFCVNNRIGSPIPVNEKNQQLYPVYIDPQIDGVEFKDKEVGVLLDSGEYYKAPTISKDFENFIQKVGLPDKFPKNKISACLWLPPKSGNYIIKVKENLEKNFCAKVLSDNRSYSEYPDDKKDNNWIKQSDKLTADEPRDWYNVNTPTITGKGSPGSVIKIKESDEITGSILGTTIVEDDGSWGVTIAKTEDSRKRIFITEANPWPIHSPSTISKELKIDTTNPKGEILLTEGGVEDFINAVTFGLFCVDRVHMKISFSDNLSGVAKVEYCKTENSVDASSITTLDYKDAGDIGNDQSVTLNFNPKDGWEVAVLNKSLYIYAKITDNAGNIYYLNSDQIMLYTDSEVETSHIYYTKGTLNNVEASVKANGNTLKEIKINKYVVDPKNYEFSKSIISFNSDFLETLNTGDYDVEIVYNPAGVENSNTKTISKIILSVEEKVSGLNTIDVKVSVVESQDSNDHKIVSDLIKLTTIKDKILELKIYNVNLEDTKGSVITNLDKVNTNNLHFDLPISTSNPNVSKIYVATFDSNKNSFSGIVVENASFYTVRAKVKGIGATYAVIGA